MTRWKVAKRNGRWLIRDSDSSWWHSDYDDLATAMDEAARGFVMDALGEPGALTRLRELIEDSRWWQAYLEACEVVSR